MWLSDAVKGLCKTIIKINDVSYTGDMININNSKIYINGKDVTPDSKNISISVEGNIENLDVASCEKIIVTGSVSKLSLTSGDIKINGNVDGDIKTTSGNVNCEKVAGSIKTISGNIKTK